MINKIINKIDNLHQDRLISVFQQDRLSSKSALLLKRKKGLKHLAK